MKKIKSLLFVLMMFVCLACPANAVDISTTAVPAVYSANEVQPKAEETIWYYRVENGVKQKRLWSITYGKWLTDWIPV